jgi:hypothetical protein
VASADIVDEAKAQGKTPADFPADDYDYFRDMDMRPDGTVDAKDNRTLKPLLARLQASGPPPAPEPTMMKSYSALCCFG